MVPRTGHRDGQQEEPGPSQSRTKHYDGQNTVHICLLTVHYIR